ncbi:MAG TPA: PHB depolymerase family esterase [Ktedonobacteraceae bacterium]|nr:PHB depolymerase family esterase [Ktedonobacteraceae bacterium]
MWQKYMHSGSSGSLPYFVYTPVSYQVGMSVPLIVMLHGCTQTADAFATSTRMNELAGQQQFIVAYPQQTSSNNRSQCWNWFKPSNQARLYGEPALIAGIVREIEQSETRWTIDARRIYVAGLSAGAAMATILGATYPDLFAAIGIHSGLEYRAATNMIDGLGAMRKGGPDPLVQGQAAFAAMGLAARVVPVIAFHGTSDHLVNPVNGDKAVQQWLYTNRLASQGTYVAAFNEPAHVETGRVEHGRAYKVYRWADTSGREVQEYWKVDGMGHGWSGGRSGSNYVDPQGPDASLAMYQFFMRHPLSAQAEEGHALRERMRSIRERFLKRFQSPSPEPPS